MQRADAICRHNPFGEPLWEALQAGDPLRHPSYDGGTSTGTLAFNLEGWIAQNGSTPYKGTLTRQSCT